MKLSFAAIALFVGVTLAAPQRGGGGNNNNADGESLIESLQATFDRDNPNGTPTNPGNPDDLNGDGVINIFEAGAQAGK